MTLTEFLLARIAQDEWAAAPFRNDLGDIKPWRCDDVGGVVRQVGQPEFNLPDVVARTDTHLTAAHIARHDPARVLAECEAKRRIVSMFAPKCGEDIDRDLAAGKDLPWMGREALRALALPFADHPDYDEAWRP